MVKHIGPMKRRAAWRERAGGDVGDMGSVIRVQLQPVNARIVIDALMPEDIQFMAVRNEFHAAILRSCFLEWHPDADR